MSSYYPNYDGQRFGSKQTQDVANWGYIILYLCVILGSLIGNGLFLFTIKKNQHLRRSHHFLLSSLAIRDLIVTILVIPFAMDSQAVKLLEWTSGDVMCKFFTFMNQVTIAVHGFTLVFLLTFLYVWYRKQEGYMTEDGQTVIRKTIMHKWSIPLIWVIASGLAVAAGALAQVHFNPSTRVNMCLVWNGVNSYSTGYKIAITLFFVTFVLPIIILSFPLVALTMQVFGCREPRLDPPHSRTAITGVILIILYGASLGPYQIYESMKIFQTVAGPMRGNNPTWGTPYAPWTVNTDVLLNALIYVACVIHPILYFAVNPEYRSGLVVAWKNLYCNKDPVQREREDAAKRQRRAMQRQYPGRNTSNQPSIIRSHQGEPLINQTQPQIMTAGLGQGHHYPYSQGYNHQTGTLQPLLQSQSGTLQPLLQQPTHPNQMLYPDQHFIDTSFESALTGTVSPQLPPVFEYDGLKYIDTARVEPKMGYSPEKTPAKTPDTPHFDRKPFAEPLDGMMVNPETGLPMQIPTQPSYQQQFEMVDMSSAPPIATSPTLKEEERRKRSSMEIEQMESSPGNTLRDRNRRQQYSLSPPTSPTGDVSPVPVVEMLQESPGSRSRRRTSSQEQQKPLIPAPYTNGTNISSSQPSLGASSAGTERSASRNSAVEIVITGRTRSRTDLCPEVPKSKFEHSV